MALSTGVWLFIEFFQPPSGWDRDMLIFLAPFSLGSAAISFVSCRAYRWLGRREPPVPE
ncbi:MAG: hypothetical protein M3Q74_09965 [Pseudomonadota bacterium]|nr:hypothetical protein [Pseudomonadota bacterium]